VTMWKTHCVRHVTDRRKDRRCEMLKRYVAVSDIMVEGRIDFFLIYITRFWTSSFLRPSLLDHALEPVVCHFFDNLLCPHKVPSIDEIIFF
jgi:hypothetical protein